MGFFPVSNEIFLQHYWFSVFGLKKIHIHYTILEGFEKGQSVSYQALVVYKYMLIQAKSITPSSKLFITLLTIC